ncbi:crotonobetainyl-CoA:carnitine CoA-transferase CaiB-like acyl-CoA transferase [Rhizobium sp. PP-F2F-G38]|uniref:CoA transferase n=1 Tax=Ferranicluibacter rubi TaxID=2715133 RepID=A0AA43ZHZ5_9HYPH|nr:CaiB/BaiF CoA-transferase family protein [Ferranicluibacter rubi]PYE34118.1 crotonobetainyl-CoA:carnitine CoA-transferase CaiB-like acyl-CoA transferase [Rhizobium sp. PP-WC-1G-195]PYE96754.1 crotonobetainyl-CoA:carnitine CoA-transferase CaiB-like acyl-CoA transferase [Rhizobium sp. PP-F2F-G38]TCP86166.1 crotonobetainyl-CoA:carnitine CoA-transferase CaiB-like acyl-CoA transferase [Rhizobium sp. PP-CC-2G-626]TCQ23561.1 crotonobetainyl-CoA:carnitine CoA-transferase CaiB-like acyl-CoA transfera
MPLSDIPAFTTPAATDEAELPLSGLLVVDMSQFLSGPYCSLRLMDLGARVIKIERPDGGDLSRRLYLSDTEIGGDSTIFHAINRAKESLAIDLKNADDLAALRKLLQSADVVIQNFRPGVIERLGLDYAKVKAINPRIVFCSISGYGNEGPWVSRPGQDLLAQSRSGVMWLNGDEGQGPVPFGLAIGDMLAGAAAAQGILAALVRRGVTSKGSHVETSLLEALVDLQFEVLTTHLNDGRRLPKRSDFRSAHAYLSAPYGVYPAADGYLAIAMTPIPKLADLLEMDELAMFRDDPSSWFTARDAIKALIAKRISEKTIEEWLAILEPADIWCAKVMDWKELMESDGFQHLDMLQTVSRDDGVSIHTTRSPLRIDGVRPTFDRAAPRIGEQSAAIREEFGL